jgi:hypothetical protein
VDIASTCCTKWLLEATLTNSGSTHTLSISLRPYVVYCNTSPIVWNKSYTGQPDCSSWVGEAMTFSNDGFPSKCTGASATVTVTAADDI